MNSKLLTGDLTWKGVVVVLAVLAAGVGIFYGARSVSRQLQSRSKSPQAVKAQIFTFLKQKSGARTFQSNAKADWQRDNASLSNALTVLQAELGTIQTNLAALHQRIHTNRDEIAAASLELRRLKRAAGILPRTGTASARPAPAMVATNPPPGNSTNLAEAAPVLTNAVFDLAAASQTNPALKIILEKDRDLAARQERLSNSQDEVLALQTKLQAGRKAIFAKQRELAALQNGSTMQSRAARDLQQQFQAAASWESLYKILGQELWLVDELLSSTNLAARQSGLQLAEQARLQALNTAENEWLACRICEAFLWPNLDSADPNGNLTATRDQLLVSAGLTFRQAGETNNYIKNSEMLISKTSNPVRADYARYQLGHVFELMGNYEAALKQYRAIETSNSMVYAARRIPIVEERIKASASKKN